MAARKAASVLPEPVGASSRVEAPSRMEGQPCTWAGVGAANAARNHAWVAAGWKRPSGSGAAGGRLLAIGGALARRRLAA